MLGKYKTKAALQGRQCHYQIHSQDSTAGDPVNCSYGITGVTKGGIPPLKQIHVVTHLPPYLAFGSCKGCSDVSNAYSSIPLACLRWTDFSFRPHASRTHEEKLTLGSSSLSISTTKSIFSKSSCGKRMFFSCDLLFLLPVAISMPACWDNCVYTQYIKHGEEKRVALSTHHELRYLHTLSTGVAQIAKPGSGGTLTGPLTKPLIEVTVMADQQHTQTHPKFTWHFLALPRADVAATPYHLSISAVSEKEARRVMAPYFILSLSGRLPAQEVSYA
ncbi:MULTISPECIES: host cell division inhibitor Icd-like protein [Erwinia]|uniref:host cell division inhibitor Icd-like protein n=2 Tax=Erwiniaceae TaxID=1903409 RepID=UPI003B96EC63